MDWRLFADFKLTGEFEKLIEYLHTLDCVLWDSLLLYRVLNEFSQDHLLWNFQCFRVANERNQELCVMIQVVFPRILVQLELQFCVIVSLWSVNFLKQISERGAYVLPQIDWLPSVAGLWSEHQAHLWHKTFSKPAVFAIEINYLIGDTVQILLKVHLIDFHQHRGALSVKGHHWGHLKVIEDSCVFHNLV